jgi:hypothetical protein
LNGIGQSSACSARVVGAASGFHGA